MPNQNQPRESSNKDKPSGKKNRKPDGKLQNYMKYSGMAFQMAIIILVGAFLGQKLDERVQTERPYFTVALSLLAIFAALYITLKDLIGNDDG